MKAYWGLDQVPADLPPSVVTIGNFDGVHRGHAAILQHALELAETLGVETSALVFDPHPTKVVRPTQAPALLSLPAERLQRFEQLGLDTGVVMRFTPEVAALTPEQFVQQVVVERLRARAVVVGENFRFGCRQAGDFTRLQSLGADLGFEAQAVPAVEIGGRVVSSTRIREAVSAGDLRLARRLLGRPFSLQGPIVKGYGVGTRETVPTLNIKPDTEVLPPTGVYVTLTCDPESNRTWKSISNIGYRPTFGGDTLSVETHVLDEWAEVRPESIKVTLLQRLRPEKRFDSADKLKEQIAFDIASARRYLERLSNLKAHPAD
jgi:riboflavin kinase/FMN adenylyltransferase